MAFGMITAVVVAMAMSCIGAVEAQTHPADVEALKELKAAIDPSSIHPTSCLGSWDFSHDPCLALSSTLFVCGFQCTLQADNHTLRVIAIALDAFGYSGPLSPYLANASSLQLLDLSNNAFNGSIPRLPTSLLKLDLSRNSFSGSMPAWIGQLSSLQILSLSYNLLVGEIPATISGLVSLERLHLFSNRFSGSIPALGELTRLLDFDASDNLLSGNMSASLPSSLTQLSLSRNRLQGRVPDVLTLLQELEVMDLSSNSFSGELNGTLFQLPSLQQINLSNNKLTTIAIPHNLSTTWSASQLVAIDLSYNQIRGQLPVFLVDMKKLSALSLRHNFFSGAIPIQYAFKASMVGAQPLLRLYLDANYLVGQIPAPFFSIIPGQIAATFGDNCLLSCPLTLSFCQGGTQKTQTQCNSFT